MPGKHQRGQSTNLRVLLATLTAMSLAALGVAVAGNPASARGPGKGTSTLTAVPLASPDGLEHYDGQVTFKVSTTVTTKPFVKLDCYQDGAHVYWSSAGFFPDYPWQWAQDFTLTSGYWTGGAADCTATLYYSAGHGKFPTLATTSFHVYP